MLIAASMHKCSSVLACALQIHLAGKALAKDMQKAATKLLPDTLVTKLRSLAEWEAFRNAQSLPVVLSISSKSAATPLLKGLALLFKDRLAFATAHANLQGMKAAINATTSPALAVITSGNSAELYEGRHSWKILPTCPQ